MHIAKGASRAGGFDGMIRDTRPVCRACGGGAIEHDAAGRCLALSVAAYRELAWRLAQGLQPKAPVKGWRVVVA